MRRRLSMVVALIVGCCCAASEVRALGPSSIALDKTAEIYPGICPGGTDPLTVVPGTAVQYCYTMTNNTGITLTTHTLVDDILGPIDVSLCQASGGVGPGNSCSGVAGPVTITADRTNVATWTASNGSQFMGTDSAQVFVKAANDDCVSATTIASDTTLPFMDMIDTGLISHATGEMPEPTCATDCQAGAPHSVWYEFVPSKGGTLCAQTCGSGYDTLLSAYDSCGLYTTELACNDDFGHNCGPGGSAGSAIAFSVSQNVPVLIRVSSCTADGVGQLQLKLDYCSIALDKTVSKDGNCPGSNMISVPSGTNVTYCYKVTNDSPITLTVHALDDSVLGPIFNGPQLFDLPPTGGTYVTTTTSSITAMTMNVATWTAGITQTVPVVCDTFGPTSGLLCDNWPVSTPMVTATDSAKVFICGDGVTDSPTEDCDDGNTANGDCCSSMCMFESGACSDGDLCTQNDTCQQGVCAGTPKVCPASDECNAGTCNPATGDCTTQPLTGTPCVNGSNGVTCFSSKGQCSNGTCMVTAPDTDGDQICNGDDVRPNVLDPSGYFYDETTAKIVAGGKVVVSRVGAGVGVITTFADGSAGFYRYDVSGLTNTEETYALQITYPPSCAPSQKCKPLAGAFDPTGMGSPVALGNYPNPGNPAFLSSNACTSFYTSFEFQSGDPHVINNNIPVVCVSAPAPVMSPWGLVVLCGVMLVLGGWALRRATRSAIN
jgi:cysteine-rich repeat protein